jgi:hypothetical protein
MWAAYNFLHAPNSGYAHETISDTHFFADPLTGVNIQRIECFWHHAKQAIMCRKKGTTRQLLASVLLDIVPPSIMDSAPA